MMYPMKQEVQHEEEGFVGENFFNVEDESMHDIFEDLSEDNLNELGTKRGERKRYFARSR